MNYYTDLTTEEMKGLVKYYTRMIAMAEANTAKFPRKMIPTWEKLRDECLNELNVRGELM